MNWLYRSFSLLSRTVDWLLVAIPGKPLAVGAIVILALLAVYYGWIGEGTVSDRLAWYALWLGLFSFWYTISQLYQTRGAAEAARTAAERGEQNAYRDHLERLNSHLEEAIQYIDQRAWKLAVLRLRDVARELRRVQYQRTHADQRWVQYAAALSAWADFFRQQGRDGRTLTYDSVRWVGDTQQILNSLSAEFFVFRPSGGL